MTRASTLSSSTEPASDVAPTINPDADYPASALADPLPTQDRLADVVSDEHPIHSPPVTVLSWLGSAVVDGLVHCACSNNSVHPDLLTLASGDTAARADARPDEVDHDAN